MTDKTAAAILALSLKVEALRLFDEGVEPYDPKKLMEALRVNDEARIALEHLGEEETQP